MKKMFILTLVLGISAIYGGTSMFVEAASTERGIVSVSASANKEIAPDTAEISFAIKTSDAKSMQKATSLNRDISETVLEQLKTMINIENGDYIKTSDYVAKPVYINSNSKQILDSYQVSNRVVIRTKSIDKLGDMIDSAINAGATNVDSLSFSLSNYETQCNELIFEATQKANTRAQIIAKALSTSLDGVSNINTSCNMNNYNPPRYFMAKNLKSGVASDMSTEESTSISGGTVKINVNINAGFFVK